MTDIVATISTEDALTVSVSDTSVTLLSTNLANPAVVESLDFVADVDVTTEGKNNGSILVYRTSTNKWTSTTTLDAQNMEGGEF